MIDKDKEAYEKYLVENNVNQRQIWNELSLDEIWQAACGYKQKEYSNILDAMTRTSQNNAKLKDENAKLRDCVEFYANVDNHKMIYDSGDGFVNTTKIDKDAGKRARKCLKELEEK